MTSKEIIEEAIKIQESNLTMVCEDNKPYCEQKINNYKQVLKDLEILEEIRISHIAFKDGDDYFLRVGKNLYLITRKQYDKWVRWLGNGK